LQGAVGDHLVSAVLHRPHAHRALVVLAEADDPRVTSRPQRADQVDASVDVVVEVDEHRPGPRHLAVAGDRQLRCRGERGTEPAGEEEVAADQGDIGGGHRRHHRSDAAGACFEAARVLPVRPLEADMEIRTVGIVGAGLMGSGIAEVCARSGLRTRVAEAAEDALAAGRQRVEKSLERGRAGGKLSEDDVERISGQLSFSTDLGEMSDCDLVVEAIVERLSDKVDLFGRLDQIVPEHAILSSNTSSLPIMEIARATHRPDRVIGTHFFNPAPVMRLLEVVRTIATSDQTLAETRALGEKLGKRVIVAQDRGGFIVNLLLIPFLNNAVRLYESGFATKDDIDDGMRLGCGHPMGPLQLLDYIGLDTVLFVCDALYEEYAIRDYAAPPLLKRMVAAGYLGRKSGRGFYEYEGAQKR
jgi:3-hydroxybutyryl-CoA dehydrogenase